MENEDSKCIMEPLCLLDPLKLDNDDSTCYDTPDFITNIKQEAVNEDGPEFTSNTNIITERSILISETPCSSDNFLPLKDEVKTETIDSNKFGDNWNIKDHKLDKKNNEACTSLNNVDQDMHTAYQHRQYDDQESVKNEFKKQLGKIYSGKSCDQCDYEGPQLKRHQLRHKNPDEVGSFKCDQCEFKTVHKFSLKMHLLLHKNPNGVMFKCDQCHYKTIQKTNLNRHRLLHRNPEDVDTFKCEHCAYRATNKDNLKKHVVRHKNPLDLVRFKCDQCSYETVRRGDLKKHLIRHRGLDEVDAFQCDQCEYRGILKDNFTKHLLVHKKADERVLFMCYHCDYQAIRKNNLKRHLRLHRTHKLNELNERSMFWNSVPSCSGVTGSSSV